MVTGYPKHSTMKSKGGNGSVSVGFLEVLLSLRKILEETVTDD